MSFLEAYIQPHLTLISILVFYSLVALWVYTNRKKFEIQAKIIALYRTGVGLRFINTFGKKFAPLLRLLGYIGIGFGFTGMVYISGLLLSSFFNLFFKPEAPSAFAPVVPGVQIPGSPVFIPFWYGIISLFIVTIVHEAAHGLVSKAHNLKVNHTGIAFFGPILAAFVEPDEKILRKQPDVVQYSMFAAGPFSNILLALLAILLLGGVLTPIQDSFVRTEGFSFMTITPFSPAFNASVPAGVLFQEVNGVTIESEKQLLEMLRSLGPGDDISIVGKEHSYYFEAAPNPVYNESDPDGPSKAIIGISPSQGKFIQMHKGEELWDPGMRPIYTALDILSNLMFWIFVLSLGIGIANLLPLGPVDGGRMLQIALHDIVGDKKKADAIWARISLAAFAMILIAVFIPILRASVPMLFKLFS